MELCNEPYPVCFWMCKIKVFPNAPDAAAGNQDIILPELLVLRLERTKKGEGLLECCVGMFEICMTLQRRRRS